MLCPICNEPLKTYSCHSASCVQNDSFSREQDVLYCQNELCSYFNLEYWKALEQSQMTPQGKEIANNPLPSYIVDRGMGYNYNSMPEFERTFI